MSTTAPAPIVTLEQAAARIQQLEKAVHLNISAAGTAIPHAPEPKLPYILIVTKARMGRLQSGLTVPLAVGLVLWNDAVPASQIALGVHPKAPGTLLVQHPSLKTGDIATAAELAAIMATKPAA